MSGEPQPQTNHIARWRIALVLGGFVLLLMLVQGRLVMLHTVKQPFLYEQGEQRTVRHEVQPAMRGSIVDRHGRPLAVSTPVVTLWLNPQQVQAEQLPQLARALDLSPAKLAQRVAMALEKEREFMYLRRQMAPAQAQKILDLGMAGVYGDDAFRRFYPAAEVTAHLLGIVNVDGKGQEGLEMAYDDYLTGRDGAREVVKDLYGNVVKQVQVTQVPEPGRDLQLTMDLRLQYIAYRELKAAVAAHHAKAGAAVLLDARNGDVLALVNQPSYNPNNRATLKPEHMRNRAIADLIEPGSTMKPFTVAAALQSGRYRASSEIDTSPGFIRVKHKAIRDHRNYGVLDITGIITKSSNVGVVKLAHDLGAESMWSFLADAGVGESTVLGFPGEALGRLPYPEQLDDLRLATVSYGYGLSVTPLQLAQAYTTFTEHGCRLPVHLVMPERRDQVCKRVMSADIARQVIDMMETVTSARGTGRRARVAGYRVGGKTGTAHKVGKSGYEDSQYTAVFAGVAPVSNPELVLVVFVDEPQGQEYYGGEVAAPIFSRIMAQALRLRQVPPDEQNPDWLKNLRVAEGPA
ncbi:penicillin-binding protein 3 [Bacterioplanes sanyensis]|uniref:peptidoglycan D,D-transpeptidase FtsI family protein n=1 Tax=Bacterioplanes sanyensis TaxID=1249553 RepID=UPI001676B965|nr:penicillin-binding protein 2 [Bacterioplanes sanyensis]GGY37773.1 penicillin-binding protein 3 [Bacterioplanes sanyensis]